MDLEKLMKRLIQVQSARRNINRMKNIQYGQVWMKYGVVGLIQEIMRITSRLEHSLGYSLKEMVESIGEGEGLSSKEIDMLIDLANYTDMALILISQRKGTGLFGLHEKAKDADR